MSQKSLKKITDSGYNDTMKQTITLILICASLGMGGCASVMLAERERALDSDLAKGRITKTQYMILDSRLQAEKIKNIGYNPLKTK